MAADEHLVDSAGLTSWLVFSSPSSGFESPEVLAGQPASPASDQFALAVLIFQMLTGTLPFGTRAIATVHDRSPAIHVQRPTVPVAVDEVLWRAMVWHPDERFATVEAFVARFLSALEGRDAVEPEGARELANPYKTHTGTTSVRGNSRQLMPAGGTMGQ